MDIAKQSARLGIRVNNYYIDNEDGSISFYYYYKKEDKIHEIIIDYEDFPLIRDHFWSIHLDKYTYYVHTFIERHKQLSLHKLITKPEDNEMVDHIDHNGLNNCKYNLRCVTNSINQKNIRLTSRNKCGHNGVHEKKNSNGELIGYIAMWNVNHKRYRKVFSFYKYGKNAFKLALEKRLEMENLYGYK